MTGSEKQIAWATELTEKMNTEFGICRQLAPVSFHHVFDQIEQILNDAYAGDVIALLQSNKASGQKYFNNLMINIKISGCAAAMQIKKEVK